MPDVRLCVLVSGSGTILEALIAADIEIALVAADRPCRGLDVARANGIDALLVDRSTFGGFTPSFDRERFSATLAQDLAARRIDVIAMAGFGTVTTTHFHDVFPGRVLNTHPSLLPSFKGWHAVRQALASGEHQTGCTVHIATVELDDGPILAQVAVAILASDDEETLHERIKGVERSLYPRIVRDVVHALAEGREPSSLAP